jgi:hypothetical protein
MQNQLRDDLVLQQAVPTIQFHLQSEILDQYRTQGFARVAIGATQDLIDRHFKWIFHGGLTCRRGARSIATCDANGEYS